MSPSLTWFIILSVLKQSYSKPVLSTKPPLPLPTAIDYMKRFGYLEGVGSDAENLYKEETITEAIKTMQRYGGINQTGVIDNDTIALFSTPRCGVPDVIRGKNKRTKRYVIGSEGWRKRVVTYYIANWSPKLGEQASTETQVNKAFKIWSDYSGLKFNQTHDINADIILFFARGPHGDGYPMDGPGNILAHAFYPYEHGNYGGDIHFDEDEDWVNGSADGFDFFTVAVHEIGHSLGLAHSHEPNSLMFPYYKGYNADFQLGYDDILGVYQLYVSRPLQEEDNEHHSDTDEQDENEQDEDEDEHEHEHEHENEHEHEHDEQEEEKHDENEDEMSSENENTSEAIDNEDDEHTDTDFDFDNESETQTPTNPSPTPTPSICDGYDAIASIRGELFVFRNEWVWRFKEPGLLDENYPVKFQQLFRFPRRVRRIDAAYERPRDNKIVFFTGAHYYLFDGDKVTTAEPLPLTNVSLPAYVDKLDAALIWGKNLKTYFFRGDEYWRYDDMKGAMDDGYPKDSGNWKGIRFPVSSAMQWTDGKTYFFVGDDFYRFNDQEVVADAQYPLPAFGFWFGC